MRSVEERQARAWQLREDGRQQEAIAILISTFVEQMAGENYKAAVDTLVDMSLSYKSLSRGTGKDIYAQTAYDILIFGEQILTGEQKEIRKDLGYYIGTAAVAIGSYKEGTTRMERAIRSNPWWTPEKRAYISSHIGFATAKMGEHDKGEKIIRDSLEVLTKTKNENVSQGKNIMAVWRTGVKLELAQVTDDKKEADRLLQEALNEAKTENLGARVREVKNLIVGPLPMDN